MLFITGDCDKNYSRFEVENFPQQLQMTKDDYVIVCGNFGAVWYGEDVLQKELEERELDWLESLPFSILFLDGNGENFEELNKYPVKEWNGGRVHEIRPGILHLIRGEVFELCGKKIFAFGGMIILDWETIFLNGMRMENGKMRQANAKKKIGVMPLAFRSRRNT